RQRALGGSYIQQVANSMVEGFQGSGVGLLGGRKERQGRLPLAKRGAQVRVSPPNLFGNGIARSVHARLRRQNVRFRPRQFAFSRPAIEQGPGHAQAYPACKISSMNPRSRVLGGIKALPAS